MVENQDIDNITRTDEKQETEEAIQSTGNLAQIYKHADRHLKDSEYWEDSFKTEYDWIQTQIKTALVSFDQINLIEIEQNIQGLSEKIEKNKKILSEAIARGENEISDKEKRLQDDVAILRNSYGIVSNEISKIEQTDIESDIKSIDFSKIDDEVTLIKKRMACREIENKIKEIGGKICGGEEAWEEYKKLKSDNTTKLDKLTEPQQTLKKRGLIEEKVITTYHVK